MTILPPTKHNYILIWLSFSDLARTERKQKQCTV